MAGCRLAGSVSLADTRSCCVVVLLIGVVAVSLPAVAGDWQMSVADDVPVEISQRQTPVVTSNYVFWGPNWKWAGVEMKLDSSQAGGKSCSGDVRDLGLKLVSVNLVETLSEHN